MTTPAELAALPSARPYPPANAAMAGNAQPGVQPGSSQFVIAQFVVVFGANGGLFIYSGSPARGNPPVYSISNATQDPYGNPVDPGIWAGPLGSIQVGIQANPGTAEVFFAPAGNYAADAAAGIVQTATQAILEILGAQTTPTGTGSDRAALFYYDHGTGAGSAALQGVYFYQSGAGFIEWFLGNYAGLLIPLCAGITAVEPGTGTDPNTLAVPETWHNITLDAGWSTAGGETAQIRLLPDGNVQVRGDISHAGTTVQTNINSANPVNSAYWPGATRYYRTPQSADGAGAVQMGTDGVLVMRASGFSANQAILDGTYSR